MDYFNKINLGATANDGNGDPIRTGGNTVNENFAEAETQIKARVEEAPNDGNYYVRNDSAWEIDPNKGGGFFIDYILGIEGSVPDSGYFSLDTNTISSSAFIKIHKTSFDSSNNELIGDVKYVMITDVFTSKKVIFEMYDVVENDSYYKASVYVRHDTVTTLSTDSRYHVAFQSIPFVDLREDDGGGEPLSFTFLDRITDTGASQGVYSDGEFLYTTGRDTTLGTHNWIRKFKKDGTLVSSNSGAMTSGTPMNQVNSLDVVGDELYVSSNNYSTTPKLSYVKVFDKRDLSYIREYRIRDAISEAATWHDGYFWCLYSDLMIVDKYDIDFNLIDTYTLDYTITGTHMYQGIVWFDDYILTPIHAGSVPQTIDVYKWNGTGFDMVRRIDQINIGYTGQGISKEPMENVIWLAERNYPTTWVDNVVKARVNIANNGLELNLTAGTLPSLTTGQSIRIMADSSDSNRLKYWDGSAWNNLY